jgi:hypothetical protein
MSIRTKFLIFHWSKSFDLQSCNISFFNQSYDICVLAISRFTYWSKSILSSLYIPLAWFCHLKEINNESSIFVFRLAKMFVLRSCHARHFILLLDDWQFAWRREHCVLIHQSVTLLVPSWNRRSNWNKSIRYLLDRICHIELLMNVWWYGN